MTLKHPADRGALAEPVVIRAVRSDESDAMIALMSRCFGLDPESAKRVFYSDPFFNLAMKRVAVEPATGRLVSCATLVPGVMDLGRGAVLNLCGLAGVCTDEAFRGRGYAYQLIERTIVDLRRELGYSVAALTAERPDIYLRLGWSACGTSVAWSAPATALPKTAIGAACKELSPTEIGRFRPTIHALYDSALRRAEPGRLLRDGRRWQCIEQLSVGRRVAMCWIGDDAVAYAAYNVHGARQAATVHLHEIAGTRDDAASAMLSFFGSGTLGSQVTGRSSVAEVQSLGIEQFAETLVRDESHLLMRSVSLSGLLAQVLSATRPSEAFLALRDGLSICVRGNAPGLSEPIECVTLRAVGGSIEIGAGADGLPTASITGDIGAMTQLVMGCRSATDLAVQGRLTASRPELLDAADATFPSLTPFLATPDLF